MTEAVYYVDMVFDLPLQQVFTYQADPKKEAALGKRGIAPFGRRECLGYIIREHAEAPPGIAAAAIKAVRRVVDPAPLFTQEDLALAEWIAGYYLCSLGQALAGMLPSGRRTGAYPTFADPEDAISQSIPELSSEQEVALAGILHCQGPAAAPSRLLYLYGITGSGKTEVFLRAAEQALHGGKSVIYLVPEIALTHQTAAAIQSRFGSSAATLHSGMSSSARLTAWVRIREGEIRIVVGPRSAVFAPVQNLGLIILDEEQDGSYKSGSTPRYHARQVAMHRCSVVGACLVMGSATPSAEAWKLMEEGTIQRLHLTRRLAGGSMPAIRSLSLARACGCLTKELQEEIRKTAQMGRQSILFLNRRGFAYFYHCRACGYELTCRRCSVSLTYHKSKGRAICHYCGYQTEPPRVCPQCGSLEAGYTGFGTELIEEEVRRTFPDLRVHRVDADTANRKESLKETLALFKAGGFDILLGTQMVAKGLNFPGVRLVGIILADTGLHLPDFRAAERTFSLIVQVAGRAGRYFPDGRVLVQTLRPYDPVILRACALDMEGFYAAELAQRKILGFPPYTRLIRFIVRSKDADRADRAVGNLAALAGPQLPAQADMLGPAECPIGMIAGNYRRQLILRGSSLGPIHAAARSLLARYETGKDKRVYVEVDIDPVSLL
ncbi:MAG: primosomal protein N' [Spirochaetaceae bacterium]|jgi:primosomal protein N' (replication factor Y)|nr:primosomal protein N' [Spirochaetaceae bacterium]